MGFRTSKNSVVGWRSGGDTAEGRRGVGVKGGGWWCGIADERRASEVRRREKMMECIVIQFSTTNTLHHVV